MEANTELAQAHLEATRAGTDACRADIAIKQADVRLKEAYTLETLTRAGFSKSAAVAALKSGDWADLTDPVTGAR